MPRLLWPGAAPPPPPATMRLDVYIVSMLWWIEVTATGALPPLSALIDGSPAVSACAAVVRRSVSQLAAMCR